MKTLSNSEPSITDWVMLLLTFTIPLWVYGIFILGMRSDPMFNKKVVEHCWCRMNQHGEKCSGTRNDKEATNDPK